MEKKGMDMRGVTEVEETSFMKKGVGNQEDQKKKVVARDMVPTLHTWVARELESLDLKR